MIEAPEQAGGDKMANDPMPDIEELLPIVFEKGETEQQIWNARTRQHHRHRRICGQGGWRARDARYGARDVTQRAAPAARYGARDVTQRAAPALWRGARHRRRLCAAAVVAHRDLAVSASCGRSGRGRGNYCAAAERHGGPVANSAGRVARPKSWPPWVMSRRPRAPPPQVGTALRVACRCAEWVCDASGCVGAR